MNSPLAQDYKGGWGPQTYEHRQKEICCHGHREIFYFHTLFEWKDNNSPRTLPLKIACCNVWVCITQEEGNGQQDILSTLCDDWRRVANRCNWMLYRHPKAVLYLFVHHPTKPYTVSRVHQYLWSHLSVLPRQWGSQYGQLLWAPKCADLYWKCLAENNNARSH